MLMTIPTTGRCCVDKPMDQVKPGCEPLEAEGFGPAARTGVVLVHGFTGSPDSTRPWAQYLNERGYTVNALRLPGHGTTWQDASTKTHADLQSAVDRAFAEMLARTDRVFLMAQSFGCTLALRVAADRPEEVAGMVLVNPWVRPDGVAGWQRHLVPIQRFLPLLVKSVPGVASDIANPKSTELGYERIPISLAVDLAKGWNQLRPIMDRVSAPILLYRSVVDHVLSPNNSELIRAKVRSTLQEVELHRSFHVATLDYDAEAVFAGSVDFIETHS
ncbi:MAG: alpha/beta fold hydrolase [Candidatus Nanopelagicales bacterium]